MNKKKKQKEEKDFSQKHNASMWTDLVMIGNHY